MTSIDSLKSITLDLPPSCVEFWPLNPQYAIVGTYHLDRSKEDQNNAEPETEENEGSYQKKNQERNGSLIIIKVIGDNV
jgi:diphthamide biosynthesis protein 7